MMALLVSVGLQVQFLRVEAMKVMVIMIVLVFLSVSQVLILARTLNSAQFASLLLARDQPVLRVHFSKVEFS